MTLKEPAAGFPIPYEVGDRYPRSPDPYVLLATGEGVGEDGVG